jgi:hypothetical protein
MLRGSRVGEEGAGDPTPHQPLPSEPSLGKTYPSSALGFENFYRRCSYTETFLSPPRLAVARGLGSYSFFTIC